jgi:hypothetical protein
MPPESSMATKPVFVVGPHNAGYYIAFIVWIACLVMTTGQFLSNDKFTVVSQTIECEQPLNNRCSNRVRVRDSDGVERDHHGLTGFRASADDLAVGNSLEKHRFHFDYRVNDQQAAWGELPGVLIASILALVPFGLARLFTPKRAT